MMTAGLVTNEDSVPFLLQTGSRTQGDLLKETRLQQSELKNTMTAVNVFRKLDFMEELN